MIKNGEKYGVLFDKINKETDGWWLLDINCEEILFPKYICEIKNGHIIMPDWFAEVKNLI